MGFCMKKIFLALTCSAITVYKYIDDEACPNGGDNHMKLRKGFTLIELLVVIGIIGILAAIVVIAVNPGRQFAQARNTQRQSDLLAITGAVYQFAADHDGNTPGTDDDPLTQEIPTCTAGAEDIGTSGINLASAGAEDGGADGVDDTIVPTYMSAIPADPSTGTAAVTGYTLCVDTNSRLVGTAATPELGATISLTR